MSPSEFSREIRERLLSFLWRQWAQLGLASATAGKRDGWVIDPEALLLLTCTAGRWDPRLFDETMDWTNRNSRFINMPRLKSLLKRYGFRSGQVCGAMAAVIVSGNSRLTWRFSPPEQQPGTIPLFYDQQGRPMAAFGHMDEVFLSFGYERGPVQLRGLSRQFNAVMPEASLLRLRSLFGISARAEIVLYLLTHKMSHPSEIARDTGFSQKNVQDTLVDTAASGIVHVAALKGRKKNYFIREKDRGPFLHQPNNPPRWVTWAPLLSVLEELLLSLYDLSEKEMSPILHSSRLRQLMKVLRPGVEASGFGEYLSDAASFPGEQYKDVFVEDIRRLFSELNTPL
jgi:hypothetical protein